MSQSKYNFNPQQLQQRYLWNIHALILKARRMGLDRLVIGLHGLIDRVARRGIREDS